MANPYEHLIPKKTEPGIGPWIGRQMKAVESAITGEGRYDEELPEFGTWLDQTFQVGEGARGRPASMMGMALLKEEDRVPPAVIALKRAVTLPTSTQGKVNNILDAAKKMGEDVSFDHDAKGNIIVEFQNKRFFLNRPGLSAQDRRELLTDVVFEGSMALPFARLGRVALGLPGQMAGAGTGAGAGSMARNLMAGEPPDPMRAGIAAAGAFAGEGFAPLVGKLFRYAFKNPSLYKNGNFTRQGRDFLEQAGLDPDDVTPEFRVEFKRTMDQTDDPIVGARVAEAESLPSPVTLSQGDVTRDVSMQQLESAAARGGYGDTAARQAVAFRQAQQQQLGANIPEIQQRIAGGPGAVTASTPQAAMETVQSALGEQEKTARDRIREAYTAAREAGGGMSILSAGIGELAAHMRRGQATFGPNVAPQVFNIVEEMGRLPKLLPGVKAIKLKPLEDRRTQLSNLRRSSDSTTRAAAQKAINDYDEYMEELLDEAMLRGDKDAVQMFRSAGRLRRKYANKFETDTIVKKIVGRLDADQAKELSEEFAIPPDEAVNLLFSMGGGAKKGATRAVQRIKQILGENSRGFTALKEAAFMRLFRSQLTGARDVTAEVAFNANKFASAMDSMLSDNPTLTRELFSREEISLMKQFKRIAVLVDDAAKVPGAVNYSNTVNVLLGLLQRMGVLGNAVATSPIGTAIIKWGDNAQRQAVRKQRSSPIPPRSLGVSPGATGAATSILGGQAIQPFMAPQRTDLPR